jgi:hypothetical protein
MLNSLEKEELARLEAALAIGDIQPQGFNQSKKSDQQGSLINKINKTYTQQEVDKTISERKEFAITAPFTRFEAGIANAALALQDGKYDEVMQGVKEGWSGKKIGEMGDVYRKAGFPEYAASTLGLATTFVPVIKTIGSAVKATGKMVTGSKVAGKVVDRFSKVAGEKIVKASDIAVDYMAKSLENAYAPVNRMAVDGMEFITKMTGINKNVVKSLESAVGKNIDDLATSVNISDVRTLKSTMGKLRPNVFGLDDLGRQANYSSAEYNKAYAVISDILHSTLNKNGAGKASAAILKADDAFVNMLNSTQKLKRVVVDPVIKKPLRGGKLARQVVDPKDTSTRYAINQIYNASKESAKATKEALKAMNHYNFIVKTQEVSGKVLNYAVYGGMAGAIGARSATRVMGE